MVHLVSWLVAIPSRLRAALAGAVALLVAFLAAYLKGRKDEAQDAAVEDLEAYRRVRKEIDDAETFQGDDPAAADRFLHERSKHRDL
jgi:hypothetical protein